MKIYTSPEVPHRPAQCERCEHHVSTEHSCLGFAIETPVGSVMLAGFKGESDEPCEKFMEGVGDEEIIQRLRDFGGTAEDHVWDGIETRDKARAALHYIVALEKGPGHKGAIGGLENCKESGVDVDGLLERFGVPASALEPAPEPVIEYASHPRREVSAARKAEAETWYQRGYNAIREGVDAEVRYHTKALTLDPNHYAAWGCLGRAHAERREWALQKTCQEAAEIVSNDGTPNDALLQRCGITPPTGAPPTPAPAPVPAHMAGSSFSTGAAQDPVADLSKGRFWCRLLAGLTLLSVIVSGIIGDQLGLAPDQVGFTVIPAALFSFASAIAAGMLASRMRRDAFGWGAATLICLGIPALVLSFIPRE